MVQRAGKLQLRRWLNHFSTFSSHLADGNSMKSRGLIGFGVRFRSCFRTSQSYDRVIENFCRHNILLFKRFKMKNLSCFKFFLTQTTIAQSYCKNSAMSAPIRDLFLIQFLFLITKLNYSYLLSGDHFYLLKHSWPTLISAQSSRFVESLLGTSIFLREKLDERYSNVL